MFKVIIVDDEQIIRRGIRNSINWEEHDFEVAGEASGGQEALELAEALKPDIVIADICMPIMDGLEMSEKLLARYPDIKIIILTGYDEFEYARKACNLGVADYLLKPTDTDDLLFVLEKAKKVIKMKRSDRIQLEELKLQLDKHMPLIRENYLVRLISGVPAIQDASEGDLNLDIGCRPGFYQVAVLDFDDIDNGSSLKGHMEMLIFAVKNICSQAIDAKSLGWTFYNAQGQVTVLMNFPRIDKKLVVEVTEKIMQQVRDTLKADFSIGIGRCYEQLRNIRKSYEEAREALEYRFIIGGHCILSIDDINTGSGETGWNEIMKVEKELLSCISKGKEEEVVQLMQRFFDSVKNQENLTPMWARSKCFELVGNLFLSFSDLGIKNTGLEKKTDELYHDIHKCSSLNKAFLMVESYAYEMLQVISQYRSMRTRKLVQLGKEYIQANYSRDISVAEISEHLRITPNYFSTIFKKETGESSVEYINRIRIENAKNLLKSTLHLTYEIAEMVGFKDANYFSLVFKKFAGMSPTDYRDSSIS